MEKFPAAVWERCASILGEREGKKKFHLAKQPTHSKTLSKTVRLIISKGIAMNLIIYNFHSYICHQKVHTSIRNDFWIIKDFGMIKFFWIIKVHNSICQVCSGLFCSGFWCAQIIVLGSALTHMIPSYLKIVAFFLFWQYIDTILTQGAKCKLLLSNVLTL